MRSLFFPGWLFVALLVNAAGAHADDDKATDGPWNNPPNETLPGTEHHTFVSPSLGKAVGFNIYLPPAYATVKERRFAVVYHLHGRTDSESTHLYNLRLLDTAIRQGKVPPLICVYTYAGRHSWFTNWKSARVPSETILREVIANVDGKYRTLARRESRGLLGWSMGGFGALKLALQTPALTGAVVSFGGGFLSLEEAKQRLPVDFERVFGNDAAYFARHSPLDLVPKRAEAIRGKVALRLAVGTKDGLLAANRRMHHLLEAHQIPHEYEEVPDVGHQPRAFYEAQMVKGFQFFVRHLQTGSAR